VSAAFKPVQHRYDDALSRVSWREFQQRIAAHFENAGFAVECSDAGDNAERGIDLILRRGDELIVATCRHWTAFQVSHNDVHRLIGQMPAAGATGAMVITSGEFTRQAVDAAARFRHVRLVDGRALRALLGPIEDPQHAPTTSTGPGLWTPLATAGVAAGGASERREAGRAAAIAAVAAVLVMVLAMLTLYTWYIRDIHAARVGGVGQAGGVYRHAGAAPAPPPFAQAEAQAQHKDLPLPGTGGAP
jgi:restriction system protein